jgi:hypothetical protein
MGEVNGVYANWRALDRSGNWSGQYASFGPIKIDLTQPNYVTGLHSTTHTVGINDCNGSITMMWDPTPDGGGSGLAGYTYLWDHNPITQPQLPLNLGPVTSVNTVLAASPLPWYFHITPADNAGNTQNQFHAGPYYIKANAGSIYCAAKVNSLGCTPSIAFTGVPNVANTSGYVITCTNVRNNKSGLLFYSVNGPTSSPFQGGTLCVKSPIKRTPAVNSGGNGAPANDCSGVYSIDFSAFSHGLLGGAPAAALTVAGTQVDCQWWGRDPGFPAPNNTTLSNGLEMILCQ